MTKLDAIHSGLPRFAGENGRYPLHEIQWDRETGHLVACNGQTAVFAPLHLKGSGSFRVRADELSGAQHMESGQDGVRIDGKPASPADGRDYPNLRDRFPGLPDVVVGLSISELLNLAAYLQDAGASTVYLGVSHSPGDNWQSRDIDRPIRFFSDCDGQQVTGFFAPTTADHVVALEARVDASLTLDGEKVDQAVRFVTQAKTTKGSEGARKAWETRRKKYGKRGCAVATEGGSQ